MSPQLTALVILVIFAVVFFMVFMADFGVFDRLLDKPYKDQLERVTKIIPYVSEYKPHRLYSHESDEAIVARLLVSRRYLDDWERKVAAIQLLDKHDPERLRLHIAELEQQLGISDGQPDTNLGKRRNRIGRRARGTG